METFAFLFSVVVFCCFIGYTEAQECGIGAISEVFTHYFDDQFDVDNRKRHKRRLPVKHIIGGKAIKNGTFPWAVYLKIGLNGGCSGTIISQNYILTAKHCTIFESPPSITVYYGSANRQEMISQVSTVTFQSSGSGVDGEDIALIKLESPIEFNENVSSICLSRSMRPKFGGVGIVAGFGLVFNHVLAPTPKESAEVNDDQMNADIPGNLYAVKVDIIEDEKCTCNCDNPEDIARGIRNGTELCAGGLQEGTLEGDSGGPLMVLDKNSMQWFQVGITARGQTYATNDSSKIVDHGVYTDVSKFCDWIESTTNKEVTCEL